MRSLANHRAVEAALALLAGVAVAPVVAALAVGVRWRMGSPVLFRQQRAGLGGVPFEILKLRTMSDGLGADGGLLPDAERLTGLGRWLRTTSLDELPELWNVVRGDMALVGPRPLPVRYLDRYTTEEGRRHDVKPGITGWAQINGRNTTTWEERLALDVWYVENRSMALDLKILAKTVTTVVRRSGISAPGDATMTEFKPSREP